MARVLLVSNRLPVTISKTADGVRVQRSSGGLASALRASRELASALWIGWPGSVTDIGDAAWQTINERFTELGVVPVILSASDLAGYYDAFANSVIWPIFHYLPGQVPTRIEGWREYVSVNEQFAEVVSRHYQPGDHIWVHDYQLLLLPAMLRERIPGARIGFFLHIPFPDAELFAILPNREAMLRGVLGADTIGFHTKRYRANFRFAAKRLLGVESSESELEVDHRRVRVGVFPVSVDAHEFEERAQRADVTAEVAALRGDGSGKLLVGVDRLDYTKGIPRRLLALEHLLENNPGWHGRVRLVQVAVPSRDTVGAYRRFGREVNTLVGEINGRFGTPHWTPVHYVHRSISETQLLALYRAADVMLVTPIRDGMNLVAKEFLATRSDDNGVLMLSEFAGAAAELIEAVIVNPFDIERTAGQLDEALRMPAAEQAARMRALRGHVFDYDVGRWTREFLAALAD